jgi:hypothetical protein
VQRVSPEGIDFVMKKGSGTCDSLADGRPLAILHLQGRYMPGETAEQWRGEGICERLPLDDLMDLLPHYTVASMVSSKRIEKEKGIILSGVRKYFFITRGCSIICEDYICGSLKPNESILLFNVQDRPVMENKSHATEIMQKTRLELENGDIGDAEIDDAIRVRHARISSRLQYDPILCHGTHSI